MSRRILLRGLLAALVLLLIAAIGAPYLSADRFGRSIQAALQQALGRRVEIGRVRFSLLFGPGFTISQVTIHEDPAFGIEPFAWVDSLQANPRLLSLFSRKLEFDSLRLEDPVVNLVKTSRWNFEPLLSSRVMATAPRILLRNGRINFKLGDTKSVFYLSHTDLDVTAGAQGEWQLRALAEPARTDRAAGGLGSFTGKGTFAAAPRERLDLDLELERSPIGEIAALIYGRDVGVHGSISARVRLTGPLSDILLAGQMRLQELHRWDQMPMKGEGIATALRGRLDLAAQQLEIESLAADKAGLPVSVRYRVSGFMTVPHWGIAVTCSQFPAEHLIPLARHLGAPIPEDLVVKGTLDGAVGYSGQSGLQGRFGLRDATLTVAKASPLRFSRAEVVLDRDRLRVPAATVQGGGEFEAQLELEYHLTDGAVDLRLSSEGMGVTALPLESARIPAPLLQSLSGGEWKGSLRYQASREQIGEWNGQIELRDAALTVPGLAEPVRISEARAQIQGSRLIVDRMRAAAGDVHVSGEYRYEPAAARPHRFRWALSDASAAEIERLLSPALRRQEGFLRRTLGIGGSPLPDWLANRHADGTIQVAALAVGDIEISNLRARVLWDGARVQLNDARARVESGQAVGHATMLLGGPLPAYRAAFQVESMDFKGGKLDTEATVETSGTGAELLTRIRAEGSFAGRGIELEGIDGLRTASGCFKLDWAQRPPRLRLTALQLATGSDLYIGTGSRQNDGRLLLQLSSGARQLRVVGTLAQLRAE